METLSIFNTAFRVYLDTNCFIYFLEDHPKYTNVMTSIFEQVLSSGQSIVTSELTIAELLVKPYKSERLDVIARYTSFLNNTDIVQLVPIDQNILSLASQIRAKSGTALADAIHIASSHSHGGCDIFLTNDKKMKGLETESGRKIIFLEDFL